MTTVRDNLIAARALIDTPEKWIKGENQIGDCFCIVGALHVVAPPLADYDYLSRSDYLYEAVSAALPDGECFVTRFNDDESTTHADVMALFDRAISSQPTQEG